MVTWISNIIANKYYIGMHSYSKLVEGGGYRTCNSLRKHNSHRNSVDHMFHNILLIGKALSRQVKNQANALLIF